MAPSKRNTKGERKQKMWDSDNEIKPEDLNLSSSEEEFNDDDDEKEEEIQQSMLEYMKAARHHDKRSSRTKKHIPSTQAAAKTPPDDRDDDADVEDDTDDDDDVPGGYYSSDDDSDDIDENTGRDDTNSDIDPASNGNPPRDPASDSSEDERPNTNTIGDVPITWYKDEEHIGYDKEGTRIIKKGRRDALERHLARSDSAIEWRTVYDEYNDEEIVLSKGEMKMIQRIRSGMFPHADIDPFEPENDWFSRDQMIMPLSGAPEPKRRFIPSKWEEKKIVKLVRAMRKGWIKKQGEDGQQKQPDVYLMWQDDGQVGDKTSTGLTYIPAPKLKLPGHEESYNPPPEYIATEEERNAAQLEAEERGEPAPFRPKAYDALRRVPAYENFIKERFERCLDLYLCPRTRIKRLHIGGMLLFLYCPIILFILSYCPPFPNNTNLACPILQCMRITDPESLVPKLPKPKDLQPFPALLALRFMGHKGPVRSLSLDPAGHWLLSGSMDGTVKLWEVKTGRCLQTFDLGEVVSCVAWCPNSQLCLAAVAAASRVVLLPLSCGNQNQDNATRETLHGAVQACESVLGAVQDGKENALGVWKSTMVKMLERGDSKSTANAVEVVGKFQVKHVSWHARGDYFCSIAPTGNTKAVLVHQLSRGATQNPFRKNRGRVVRALFHPNKPFFFVATQQAVRVYNLAKQSLAKKLISGSGVITSMDIHSTGDHVIVGAEDKRLCWYDLDLSAKPYRALRYHDEAVRGAAYHPSYPLFASSSDDATVHIFHGMVYADLLTNPLIVPVKILRGHKRVDAEGVLDVKFHPKQPWIFTAGADSSICMFVNP